MFVFMLSLVFIFIFLLFRGDHVNLSPGNDRFLKLAKVLWQWLIIHEGWYFLLHLGIDCIEKSGLMFSHAQARSVNFYWVKMPILQISCKIHVFDLVLLDQSIQIVLMKHRTLSFDIDRHLIIHKIGPDLHVFVVLGDIKSRTPKNLFYSD